jgi:hypothetical protein
MNPRSHCERREGGREGRMSGGVGDTSDLRWDESETHPYERGREREKCAVAACLPG